MQLLTRNLIRDPLIRAWAGLMGLITAATLIAQVPLPAGWPQAARAGAILLIAGLKARIILSRYLGLWRAPWWQRGFVTVIALFLIVVFMLHLIAFLR